MMRQPMRRQTLLFGGGTRYDIEVGKQHPYLEPPLSGGQAMGLERGFLACDAFLTPPLDAEARIVQGTCVACGIYLTQELVVPIFVFQGENGEGEYAIYAPINATADNAERWINSETNSAWFYLMEAGSGVVHAIRNLGLDSTYMSWLKAALRYINRPADIGLYQEIFSRIGEEGLWAGARKWVYVREHDCFVELDKS